MPGLKSLPRTAMRGHPEVFEFTGFSDKSENDVLMRFSTFYEAVKFNRAKRKGYAEKDFFENRGKC